MIKHVDVYSVVTLPVLSATSVFAGFAIFSILGHMAFVYKRPVGEVVKEGKQGKLYRG